MMADKFVKNRYQLKDLLGQGATAQVYLAEDVLTGEPLAVKVCRDCDLLGQEERLLREMPEGVFPSWVDYFEEGCGEHRRGFLVMEYMEGDTLQKSLEKQGRYPAPEAVRIVLEVLDCLKYLHNQTQPVIYRDIKPGNIMFDRRGKARLVDAASAIEGKYRVGTYGYAAPEQFWNGVKLGPECDLYAVGKLLAYLLTGKNPGEPPYDMLHYCSRDRNVAPPFFQVLQRSVAVEGMGRYASAEEFSRELKVAFRLSQKKCRCLSKKHKIVYEKCIWKSEYQRIF